MTGPFPVKPVLNVSFLPDWPQAGSSRGRGPAPRHAGAAMLLMVLLISELHLAHTDAEFFIPGRPMGGNPEKFGRMLSVSRNSVRSEEKPWGTCPLRPHTLQEGSSPACSAFVTEPYHPPHVPALGCFHCKLRHIWVFRYSDCPLWRGALIPRTCKKWAAFEGRAGEGGCEGEPC